MISRRLFTLLAFCLALVSLARDARAQAGATPGLYVPGGPGTPEQRKGDDDPTLSAFKEAKDRDEDPVPPEFSMINYFFARFTVTDQLADPSGLRGVSLGPIGIGQGIGSATRVGEASTNFYAEQRWIPVFSYSPLFVDGLATFRAQLEVDFTWGLAANSVQNNQGGGFNVDQVNIQSKNVNVAFYPTRNPKQLSIIAGAQPVYDSPYDPTITSLFDIVQTGYKLAFMGSDAVGISAYFNDFWGIGKVSFIPVGAAQPDKALTGDARFSHIYLFTADYGFEFQPGTVAGVSFWHLQDDTKGSAFAYEGIVPSGPSSGALSAFTGTAPFQIEEPSGNVEFVGAHFHHNLGFKTGPLGLSGFTMANFGRFDSQKRDTALNRRVDILGFASNLEAMFNWGRTAEDKVTLEGMFSTGDSDVNDDTYNGVFTMNYYGLPGAVWFNHKTQILFPYTSTVSNYTGAVTDISNQGFGLISAIASWAYDIIPNKLNLRVGNAYGQSVERPTVRNGVRPGRVIGYEINAELKWHIRYLMTVGVAGAYLFRGSFYDGNQQVTSDPWAAFTTFTWYAF